MIRCPRPPRPPRATATCCSGKRQVCDQLASLDVTDDGPERNRDYAILARLPLLILATSMCATFRLEVRPLLETDQCVEVRVSYQTHIAPIASITAIGTAKWFVFLPAEGDATITSPSAL